MSDVPFKPADPARFSEHVSEAQAIRFGTRLLQAGMSPREVREIVRPFGLGVEPILEVIDGGKAPETGETE